MLVQRAVIHTDRSRGLFIDHPHILCPSRQIMSTYPHVKHMPFIPVHTDMNICVHHTYSTLYVAPERIAFIMFYHLLITVIKGL